jgi:hypothetical protein
MYYIGIQEEEKTGQAKNPLEKWGWKKVSGETFCLNLRFFCKKVKM